MSPSRSTTARPKGHRSRQRPARRIVAPPRTIADITAVLDDEKPDPATLAKLRDEAEAEPEKGLSISDLAEFYLDRGNARTKLARNADAIADAKKGLAIPCAASRLMMGRLRVSCLAKQIAAGDLKAAVEIFQRIIRETQNVRDMGVSFRHQPEHQRTLILSGDTAQAEGYLRRMQTYLMTGPAAFPKAGSLQFCGRGWEADFEGGRATIFEARGQYREAETAYRKAADYRKARSPIKDRFGSQDPHSEVQPGRMPIC